VAVFEEGKSFALAASGDATIAPIAQRGHDEIGQSSPFGFGAAVEVAVT
jgi:hypothetical protein